MQLQMYDPDDDWDIDDDDGDEEYESEKRCDQCSAPIIFGGDLCLWCMTHQPYQPMDQDENDE